MPDTESLDSLAALLYHLGGEAYALPLATDPQSLHEIGTLGDLPVWAGLGDGRETLRTARQLARHGRLGIVMSACRDRWLLAVTLHPVRLALVRAGDRDALPLARMALAARIRRNTAVEMAIALADALDVDAAGRQTFRLLHQMLEQGVALLPQRLSRDSRHAWTLAQLTRLLFLRFVESEGWLDNNPRFLATQIDRCLSARRDPARHLLHPLFFGTLNKPVIQRSRLAHGFGAIPFLNGGLFEPLAIERAHRLHLPADYWRDVFAALVDRVDVTLDHDTSAGRVTPELLGRVFEGVMDPEERKEQGTFFTPPALVDAILRDALTAHLTTRLSKPASVVERALGDPDPDMLRTLGHVTVLDPAAGSGAFLVGALGLLHGPGPRNATRLRRLMTHSLFGVDRHPGAVRITELRLWLELLRAMRGEPSSRIPPLPNLDASIRAGDSLIDPLHGRALTAAPVQRLREPQQCIASTHGAERRAAMGELRRVERQALLSALDAREASVDARIDALIEHARAPTLFGDRPQLSPGLRRALASERASRRVVRAERRRVARDATASPFALGVAFAPAMARRGGFDLIVGNPPWVRAERLAPATRVTLGERYRWWHSATGAHWHHQPDLAVAFVERSHELLAPGGTLGLLLPAKLATAAYATTCREALVSRTTIHCVADLGCDPRAGFDATTYPLALTASRRPPDREHRIRFALGAGEPVHLQRQWKDGAPWVVASAAAQEIAARMAREHPTLGMQMRVQLGVKTGVNAAFFDPPEALRRWCRPAIRGRDVRPFTAAPGVQLLWPADARGKPWRQLPDAVAAHLAAWQQRLQARADQQHGAWWQLFRTGAATAKHRVIWRDLAPHLQAVALPECDMVPLNTCYVVSVPRREAAEALAAWLNATPIRVLARLVAEPAAGGMARFGARAVAQVPLPAKALHDARLAAYSRTFGAHSVQAELDELVSRLLGLSTGDCDALDALAQNRR